MISGVGIRAAQVLVSRTHGPHKSNKSPFRWPAIAIFMLLIVYETALATLALTHMVPPDSLTCHLDQRWGQLFSNKNGEAIRRIQDAYQCCGLHSVVDKAWPLPDNTHGSDACVNTFGRQNSCFGDWRRDEQISGGLLLLVAVTTLLLKVGGRSCNGISDDFGYM